MTPQPSPPSTRIHPWPGVLDSVRAHLQVDPIDVLCTMDWPGSRRRAILHVVDIDGGVRVHFLVPDDASERADRFRLYEARTKGPLTMPGWSAISRIREIAVCDPRDVATLKAILREVARRIGRPAVRVQWEVRVSGSADPTDYLHAFTDADLATLETSR